MQQKFVYLFSIIEFFLYKMKLVNWNYFCVELLKYMYTFAILIIENLFLWRESEREGSHNTLTFRHFIILLSIKPPSRSEWVDRQKLAEIIVISPLKSPISVKNHVTPPPSILWIPPCEHHHHQTIPLHQHRLSNHLSPPIDISFVGIGTNTNYSLWSQISNQTAAFLDKPPPSLHSLLPPSSNLSNWSILVQFSNHHRW